MAKDTSRFTDTLNQKLKDPQNQALTEAVCKDNEVKVSALLADGVDVNAPTLYRIGKHTLALPPLSAAVHNNNSAMVHLLLSKGANPNQTANNSNIPLMGAILRENYASVHCLIEFGADVNVDDTFFTPLTAAMVGDQIDIIRLLLHKGANPNIAARIGDFPLIEAASKQSTRIAGMLLAKGANVDIQSTCSTPLMSAIAWKSLLKNNDDMVTLILAHGADPNTPNLEGDTPLMVAAVKGDIQTAKLLLAMGAKVNAQGERLTPLLGAVRSGDRGMVALMLEHDADPLLPNRRGCSPMQEASGSRDKTFLRLLQNAEQKRYTSEDNFQSRIAKEREDAGAPLAPSYTSFGVMNASNVQEPGSKSFQDAILAEKTLKAQVGNFNRIEL